MIKEQISKNLKSVLKKIGAGEVDVEIEHPANADFGDYSTSVALKLTKTLKKNPFEIAKEIAKNFPKSDFVEKLEVIKPGFVNFWISKKYLLNQAINSSQGKFNLPQVYQRNKVMVEYTDPNLFKEFHIGHFYSNIVGESLAYIFESLGAEVRRVNYQGDVGMHVAKAIWGMTKTMKKEKIKVDDIEEMDLRQKAKFMGKSYTLGTREYDENETSKKEIIDINKKIYSSDPNIKNFYEQAKVWSLDYFDSIYKRLGTNFDNYFFESSAGKLGLECVKENLKKGIFEKSKGAIVFNGEKYGLHTRVFINSLGLPTYEAKDLGLAITKYKTFPYDLSIIVVGNEVKEYFKVVLKALETINSILRKKTINVFTGMVRLPEGKMSSRQGNVITVEWLLDEVHKKALAKIQETTKTKSEDETAESVGVGAVKYTLLKNTIGQDIEFNFETSISFDGNAGPYLQYTYVRCQSVMKKNQKLKIKNQNYNLKFKNINLANEEKTLLRIIYQFPEVAENAAKNFAPNNISNYIFDLAQKYNLFYQKYPILKAEKEVKELRLLLTKSVAQIVKKGLYLLGIETVEKM